MRKLLLFVVVLAAVLSTVIVSPLPPALIDSVSRPLAPS